MGDGFAVVGGAVGVGVGLGVGVVDEVAVAVGVGVADALGLEVLGIGVLGAGVAEAVAGDAGSVVAGSVAEGVAGAALDEVSVAAGVELAVGSAKAGALVNQTDPTTAPATRISWQRWLRTRDCILDLLVNVASAAPIGGGATWEALQWGAEP